MNDKNELAKEVSVDLKNHISYANGSVVRKTLVNKNTGPLTLFAFDEGQEGSELVFKKPARYPAPLYGSFQFLQCLYLPDLQ